MASIPFTGGSFRCIHAHDEYHPSAINVNSLQDKCPKPLVYGLIGHIVYHPIDRIQTDQGPSSLPQLRPWAQIWPVASPPVMLPPHRLRCAHSKCGPQARRVWRLWPQRTCRTSHKVGFDIICLEDLLSKGNGIFLTKLFA